MTTHVGVEAHYINEEGEEAEDSFSYYGPVPEVGDLFILDHEPGMDPEMTDAPNGPYYVQRRAFHLPQMGWRILIVSVDALGDPDQNADDSDEED